MSVKKFIAFAMIIALPIVSISSCKTKVDCPAYGKSHPYKKATRV